MKTREEYINVLKQFKNRFASQYGIRSIGIFGSVARNEHHDGSDLDVFVELDMVDPFVMFDIQEILEKMCGCKVDLIRKRDNLRQLLINRIQRDGIYA